MTDLNTTNARVQHQTLANLRELKELLQFKTLSETWDYVVTQALAAPRVAELRTAKARHAELLDQVRAK